MKYYVYALLDPRKPSLEGFAHEPFYIGKGSGNRCFQHLKEDFEKESNPYKCYKIKSIRDDGFEPIVVKVYETDEEEQAYFVEESLITKFGIANKGILTNLIESGRPPSRKGCKISEEQKSIISKVNKERLSGKTYEEIYGEKADEVKKNVGAATKIRMQNVSKETREKLSKSNSRSYLEIYGSEEEAKKQAEKRSETRIGQKRTLEQRKRISDSMVGRKAHNKIPVVLDGKSYDSLTEASIALNVSVQTISRKIKQS